MNVCILTANTELMKTIRFNYLFLATLLMSCGSKQLGRFVCNCEQRENIELFVTSNIKSANNMSDEEMEDVIAELTRTGIKLHCDFKPVWIQGDGYIDFEKQKIDSCQTIMLNY